MTLIVGLNLSDRLYIAADTRVTKENGKFEDNIIKIQPLVEINDYSKTNKTDKGFISVATAGNIKLASFLFTKIKEGIETHELDYDIRELYNNLNYEWSIKLANEWLDNGNEYNKSCALIFAGTFPPRQKRVSIPRVNELMNIYEKAINEIPNSSHNTILEDQIIMVPGHFIEPLLNGTGSLLNDLPDSLIFGIEFGIYRDKQHFKKKKAEWGEMIARGSNGITESSLPSALLAQCELMYNRTDKNAALIIAKVIKDFSQKIGTIGGNILINVIMKNISYTLQHQEEFEVREKKLFIRDINKNWVEGVSFLDYLKKNTSAEL